MKSQGWLPALASLLVLLAACSPAFGDLNSTNSDSTKSVAIAKELHAKPIPGFDNLAVLEPDSDLSRALNSGRTDSSYEAIAASGTVGLAECQAMVDWVDANLDSPIVNVQYNPSVGIQYAVSGCLLVPRFSFPNLMVTGTYQGVVVQVTYSMSGKAGFTVNVDGTGASMWSLGLDSADPKVELIRQFMSALDVARSGVGASLTAEQVEKVWVDYPKPEGEFEVTWTLDSERRVHQVHFNLGHQGLLPLCVNVDPWNATVAGLDPGPDYLLILQDALNSGVTFGSAVSGDCP